MSSAGDKRKHESGRFDVSRLRKRQKAVNHLETQVSNLRSSHSSQDILWQARVILAEKVVKGKKHYLIDWEGIDPKTGQNYKPSWGKRPTKALRKEWEEKQRGERAIETAGPATNNVSASDRGAAPSIE